MHIMILGLRVSVIYKEQYTCIVQSQVQTIINHQRRIKVKGWKIIWIHILSFCLSSTSTVLRIFPLEADACVMATPTRATEATPTTLTSWSAHVNITHAAANARLAVQDLSRRNGSRQGQTKSSCVNVSYV